MCTSNKMSDLDHLCVTPRTKNTSSQVLQLSLEFYLKATKSHFGQISHLLGTIISYGTVSGMSIVNFRSLILRPGCCSLCLFSGLGNFPCGLMGKRTHAMLYGICGHVDATLLLLECRVCWGVGWTGVFQCRSSGLGLTTLVSILLLGSVFFEGSTHASNPLFCQLFWCPIILCSCRSSCFHYKSPHPLGSLRLQADSLPAMRHNASTEVTGAAVYLTPIFPKLSRRHYPLTWHQVVCPGL